MLNRRSFLKSALLSPLLGVFGLKKDKLPDGFKAVDSYEGVAPDSWSASTSVRFMDFPERVVRLKESSDGHIVVFCERSVWTVSVSDDGFMTTKLLSHNPELSMMHQHALDNGCIGVFV